MDTKRKRELKQAYLEAKPDMGVFAVYCGEGAWIGWSKNLKATSNGVSFQLKYGTYINRELQKSYSEMPETYRFVCLEQLEYDETKIKDDYSDDLTALQEMWLEQMPHAQRMKGN